LLPPCTKVVCCAEAKFVVDVGEFAVIIPPNPLVLVAPDVGVAVTNTPFPLSVPPVMTPATVPVHTAPMGQQALRPLKSTVQVAPL
jgi:hypothetical protein